MAALEISKELSGLFEKIQQGARLITPADQQIFASEITRLKTTSLLIEALETFEDRNAYGERMTEAQEQQLERRLTKLSEMN